MQSMNRRNFIKTTAAATAAGSLLGPRARGETANSMVCVVKGTDVSKMLAAGIEKLGGWGAFVVKGQKTTVKPNAAWASKPEQGGNTCPELVGACVAACKASGASEVVVPENGCSPAHRAFSMSGIEKAVKEAGGKMYSAKDGKYFKTVEIPDGKVLKKVDVVRDILETGCLINMPVAKHHRAAGVTLSMKNWLGSVQDRGAWHRNGLHQCIADFSTFIKPKLIVIDATRIMLTNGPRGPGEMANPNEIILSTDPVAADAYAATLFKKKPMEIGAIRIAHEMGIGMADPANVELVRISV